MPEFSATAIALLCLFTLSIAAQTSPQDDGATTQVTLPDSDVKPVLRLPSDPSNAEADATTAVVKTSVPVTKMTFHPVNRRFPLGSKKGCHHSKVFPTARENHVISYGNDMLVASGENSDFQNPVVHGEDASMHHRWARMHHRHHHHHHHDEDSDSDSDDEEDQTEKKKKFVLHRFHFDGKEKELKEKKGCFFKRLRKFLGHYF